MVKKIVLSVAAILFACASVLAQNKQVSGTVTGSDGSPVVGATVVVEGTSLGTSTDLQGKYILAAPTNGTLVISFIGYEDAKLAINGKTTVNVVLKEASKTIEDVIVVAFGEAKKEAFTGSAKVVSSEDLSKIQTTNAATALSGKVAGLQMSTASGDLGANPTILIRGVGSINAGTAPLWVVDGMPYEGDINNINMADIESITVLKDAASNALYGARGANGVIMVTTKRAKVGDAIVNVDAKWGVNSRALQEYDVIKNPGEYYETHYQALLNYYRGTSSANPHLDAVTGLTGNGEGGLGYNVYSVPEGQFLIGENGKLNPAAKLGNVIEYNGKEYMLLPDNWLNEAYQTSFRQEYNASISAATAKSNFFASFGYLDNTGIIQGSEMDRLTTRLKADYQAKKWLKVGANMSYTNFRWSNGNDGEGEDNSTANIFAFASGMAPIYPVYMRDGQGNIMIDEHGYKMYDYGSKGNAGLTRPNFPDANALQTSWLNKYYSEGNAFSASGFADFLLYKGLKFTVNASTTIDETRSTSTSNPYYGQFASSGGAVSKSHSRSIAYNLQQLLTYKESFGKHNVDLMLGHEYYNTKGYSLSGYKTIMADYNNDELAGAIKDASKANSSRGEYNAEGFFFRAGYDYDERYFVSASYRRDASSNFHPKNRWGNFWSVGAAWLINKESWFNAPWVDLLKIKASYGSQGNDNIGSYLYTDTYVYENNGDKVAVLFNSKGNPDITWETNTNLNAGVEFGFWKNRLYGSVDYFHRKTSDMLFFFTVPESLGYSGYYSNVGDMVNQGVEVELGADIIRRKNFLWSLNFNLANVNNKVTYLADQHKTASIDGYDGYISGSKYHAEGLPLHTFYMRSYAGVDKTTGEALYWKDVKDKDGNVIDREKTKNYTEATRYLQGDAMADVYGGFTTSFNFYGVDISANFTYQIGGLVYDYGYASYMSSPQGTTIGGNYHRDLHNAWTPENPDSNIPRLQYGDLYTASQSDRFLTDASYLNIQNITVGYTLPTKITRKFLVEKLRIYVVCDNVWYWSRRKGLDPRQSMTGGSSNTMYSPIRTISGGINITF